MTESIEQKIKRQEQLVKSFEEEYDKLVAELNVIIPEVIRSLEEHIRLLDKVNSSPLKEAMIKIQMLRGLQGIIVYIKGELEQMWEAVRGRQSGSKRWGTMTGETYRPSEWKLQKL